MKSYVVINEFLDKYDNHNYCAVGSVHTPHNEARAKLLLDLGFLGEEVEGERDDDPVADESGLITHLGGVFELPNGVRVKGKAKAIKAIAELQAGGGADEPGEAGSKDNVSE